MVSNSLSSYSEESILDGKSMFPSVSCISKLEEKKELTTYSYISNGLYFEYFIGYEIATLLGYKNTRAMSYILNM